MRWFQAFLVLLALARPAFAAPLPDGGVTAQDVAQVMQEKGFAATIATDKEGDPLIRSSSKDLKFGVFFYGCHGKPRCDSIQFSAGFSVKGVTPEKIAQWNTTKRFGRAYLDKVAEPWVEMDMDVEHGATTEALANNLDRWVGVIGAFNGYINK
jgi:Putative bacterial sensory transduction regulator